MSKAYEALLGTLVGRSITAVAYFGEDEGSDSLEHGVSLALDDASRFSITWGWEFGVRHGVELHRGPIPFAPGVVVPMWEATARWRAYLNRPIARTSVVWRPYEDYAVYPQSVVFRFAEAAVIVLSAYRTSDMADHITVFFDEQEPGRLGLL